MASLGNRITDLIGSDYEVIPSNSVDDLINAGISEVADMLPPDLLLKYSTAPIELDASPSTATDIEGKKILLVTRLDAGGGKERECTAVSIPDFNRAKDSDSIYLATKFSPVYYYNGSVAGGSTLEIYPTPTDAEKAYVYNFEYPNTSQKGLSTISGLPDEAIQAVALKASINILTTYVSDFAQDEEDLELQQMIEAQKASLVRDFQQEMSRWMEQDATPRGE